MAKPLFTFYRRRLDWEATKYRYLDWEATKRRVKEFFKSFPYDDFNAKKREEGKPEEQIHHRWANIKTTVDWIVHLILEDTPRKVGLHTPIRYALKTYRSSLGTHLGKATRTIDRHLAGALDMGVIEQKRLTGRGLELVLAASLFVFTAAPTPQPAVPAPAAVVAPVAPMAAASEVDVPLDPWMRAILHNTSVAELMAKKWGVFTPEAPS